MPAGRGPSRRSQSRLVVLELLQVEDPVQLSLPRLTCGHAGQLWGVASVARSAHGREGRGHAPARPIDLSRAATSSHFSPPRAARGRKHRSIVLWGRLK